MPEILKVDDFGDVCDTVDPDFEGSVATFGYKLFFAPDSQYPERQMKINKMIFDYKQKSIVFLAE